MSEWVTVQLCMAGRLERARLLLGEWWENLTAFFRIEARSGAYWALAFAALLYLAGVQAAERGAGINAGMSTGGIKQPAGKGTERTWRVLLILPVWFFLFMNPAAAWLFRKLTGVSYRYVYAALALPVLPVIACAAADVYERCKSRRVLAMLFLTAALAVSGTLYPFDEKGGTPRRSAQWNEAESGAMEVILSEARSISESGEETFLAAPKRIMDAVRRYDADILLPYGRDLWQTDALAYVHDGYSEEQIVLCQAMEAEPFQADETAELALMYGCNLIALKEPVSTATLDNWGLSCVYESEDVYVYRR